MNDKENYELKVHIPTGKMVNEEMELRTIAISLNEPTFDQYQGAMLAMETPSGNTAKLYAGRFILTTCVINEDRDKLAEIEKNTKAHVAAALDAYELLGVYTSEIKKK